MLSEKPTVVAFARAFRPHVEAALTGLASIPLSFAAAYVDGKAYQIVFATFALLCAGFAAFKIWRVEREKVLALEMRLSPKLSLSYESRSPWVRILQNSNIPTRDNPNNKATSVWYRIKASTVNKDAVVNCCEAALTKVEFLDGSDYRELAFVAQPLPWGETAYGHSPVDISHSAPMYVDVFSLDPHYNAIKIKWPSEYIANQGLFEKLGKYRLTVTVRGRDCVEEHHRLIVDWAGDWNAVLVKSEALSCHAANTSP